MNVSMHHYRRHLGLPADAAITGRVAELAAAASAWYTRHGEPWTTVVQRQVAHFTDELTQLDGGPTLWTGLATKRLHAHGVESLSLVAATAGENLDAEVRRLWSEDRPDESFFLSALGITVVEELREAAEKQLTVAAGLTGWRVLPRSGPGYEGWDLAGMPTLLAALGDPGPIRATAMGGLVPEKSTVVVLGWTRAAEPIATTHQAASSIHSGARASYDMPEKTLAKWSQERLRIESPGEGQLVAHFRFDGKTCSSLSRPLAYDFRLDLETIAGDYRITAGSCAPASGDRGHRFQCEHISDPEGFSALTRGSSPPLGQTLSEACAAATDVSPSACLCSAGNRRHKWRLVVQTIHYALHELGVGRLK